MDSELHCRAACAKTCDLVNVTVLNFWVKKMYPAKLPEEGRTA